MKRRNDEIAQIIVESNSVNERARTAASVSVSYRFRVGTRQEFEHRSERNYKTGDLDPVCGARACTAEDNSVRNVGASSTRSTRGEGEKEEGEREIERKGGVSLDKFIRRVFVGFGIALYVVITRWKYVRESLSRALPTRQSCPSRRSETDPMRREPM